MLRASRPDAAARCLALPRRTRCRSGCYCRLPACCRGGGLPARWCRMARPPFLARYPQQVHAPQTATYLNRARGARDGSITVPTPALPTFANRTVACLATPGPGHAAFAVRAAAWLSAALPPDRTLIALRRLRLPLPVASHRCGAHGHGCEAAVDACGDHHAACPRTGLLAHRAKPRACMGAHRARSC